MFVSSLNYFLKQGVKMNRNNPHNEWPDRTELFHLRTSHTVTTLVLLPDTGICCSSRNSCCTNIRSGNDCSTHIISRVTIVVILLVVVVVVVLLRVLDNL